MFKVSHLFKVWYENKLKSLTLIAFGLVFGILISVNLSVFADE